MYMGNVFNDRGILLYSANTLIIDYAQIEALRRQGVSNVSINLDKGKGEESPEEQVTTVNGDSAAQPAMVPETAPPPFDNLKVEEAVSLRNRTLDAVHDIMSAAATGRMFSLNAVADNVSNIVDLMLGDPDLLLNINRLKSESPVAYVHSVNVAVLMVGFASALGYSRSELLDIGIGGMLHDIGKIRLPEELLFKHGSCTRQEFELFKKHPSIGLDIIEKSCVSVSPVVKNIIGQHHERANGGGYPQQLQDEHIDDLAMVCAIADMYDSMTSDGSYRRTYIPQEALALIFQGADEELPRRLVEHFTKLLGIYPVGSFVKIDSGEMGVVIRNNRSKLLMPIVKILFDENGTQLATPYIKDLSIVSPGADEQQTPRVVNSLDPAGYNLRNNQFFFNL
jgi:putative nucleotidyltransferase with HDIG domain